jgi:uncharacterized protein (TIGR03066 family)
MNPRTRKPRQAPQPAGGTTVPWRKLVLMAAAVAVVAAASFAAFAFVLPGKVPRELVGRWRVVGGEMDGTVFEFQHNGTMTGRKSQGVQEWLIEGTAEVTGDTLRTTTTRPNSRKAETGTQTIITLTDTEFVTEDASGARVTMTRVR